MKWLFRFSRKRVFVLLAFVTVMVMFTGAGLWHVFNLPSSAQLSVIRGNSQSEAVHCYRNKDAKALDENGKLSLLVWNIYKQTNDNWQQKLSEYSNNTQLALLQEVSMTDEFKEYINTANWFGSHVDAFKSFDVTSGVLNLSRRSPLLACAHLETEPWLRLPKSGIFARYSLSNNKVLAVVNLHSVNFAYGNEEYTRQFSALVTELDTHKGPVIFAGDLNTWNPSRIAAIKEALDSLGLQQVVFSPDNRTQFVNGMALDHIFYRGLELIDASSPITDASDHNPLLVSFTI